MIDEDFVVHGQELPGALPEMSFGQYCFEKLREKDENFVTLVEAETGQEFTTKELLEAGVNIGTGLRSLGICKGDTVCLVGSNKFDINAAALATLLMGAVMTPLDTSYKAYEYQHMFGLVEPKLVICDVEFIVEIKKGLAIWGGNPLIYSLQEEVDDVPSLSSIAVETDVENFEPEPCDDVNDIIVIVGSSGSTGLSKAVGLTHANMIYQIFLGKKIIAILPTPVLIQTSFFFWISSVIFMTLSICECMKRVLLKEIDDVTVMKAVNDYKPNWAMMAPSLLSAIVQHPDLPSYDLSSLIAIAAGGSPLQLNTAELAREKLGPRLLVAQVYGMSELSGAFSSLRPDLGTKSVGGLLPGVEIRVVDIETGANLPPDEEGEIYGKSPGLMKCYVNNPEGTAEAVDEDGWFHTGDVGYYTSQGAIFLTGRKKELWKLDNHQVAPAEIEQVISAVSGVADVAVAGIKISEDSCHPMALVVKNEDFDVSEEDIIKAVNDNLSDHKQLRAGVCFVGEIPRTKTGKIIRRRLQEIADELYMGDTKSVF